jgi:NAD(P)-dependent dehydrogenase (short-subunit alcohol dehydrogenase family)
LIFRTSAAVSQFWSASREDHVRVAQGGDQVGTAGIAAINGAVEALVKPLAAELGPIRVNGVSPGLVDTPWRDGLPEDTRRSYFTQAAQQLPARRIANDIADAVVLAATNPNLTGTIIETDGGARLISRVCSTLPTRCDRDWRSPGRSPTRRTSGAERVPYVTVNLRLRSGPAARRRPWC